jgi:glycosyltransferase involved in cell wall biosynthesis
MKILHVITSLYTGGAEKLMVDLLPQLEKLGNNVDLLLFDGTRTPFYDQIEASGITIHHLSMGGNVYSPSNIFKSIKFFRRFDVIHTHNTACQLFLAIAKTFVRGGAKLVTTEHSSNNRRRGNKLFFLLDKWMYARYQRVICIADKTEVNLKNYIGNRPNIMTIYNGVNLSKYNSEIRLIHDANHIVVVMVAGFRVGKDQDTLIRAIAQLPLQFSLQLVGDGIRRPEIEALIHSLGVENRVELLGVRNDVPDILKSADIIVLASHWEGLSLSSIEGMASGRPFVASDVDGLREIVGGNGVLFHDGDADALAGCLKELSENPDLYRSVAEKCKQKALQYDISIMAAKYNEVYKEICTA